MSKIILLPLLLIIASLLGAAVVNAYREGDERRRLRAREAIGFEVHKWW
jgi:hypothetical protein